MENIENLKVPCEVFSRVVGYFRPVSNFNDGKVAEHKERIFFKEDCGC